MLWFMVLSLVSFIVVSVWFIMTLQACRLKGSEWPKLTLQLLTISKAVLVGFRLYKNIFVKYPMRRSVLSVFKVVTDKTLIDTMPIFCEWGSTWFILMLYSKY
jgi:hypothetical protein